MVRLLIAILVVTIIAFLYQYSEAKSDFNDVKRIRDLHNKWVLDPDNEERPNNALFKRLYEGMTGESIRKMKHYEGSGRHIITRTLDVVATFPSIDRQVQAVTIPVLENMFDHYQLKLKTVSSPRYWIKFIIFMPAEIIEFFGLSLKRITKCFLTFIFWLLNVLISMFNNQIRDFIVSLFK